MNVHCLRAWLPVIALSLAACGEAPEGSAPVDAAPLHGTIRDVGWYPPILNQEIDFGKARSAAVLTAAGEEALALGKQMNQGHNPVVGAIDTINFVVLGGAGSDTTVGRKILQFSIKAEVLQNLAKNNASGTQILDAASEVVTWSPANDDVLNSYCQSDTPFCQKAR